MSEPLAKSFIVSARVVVENKSVRSAAAVQRIVAVLLISRSLLSPPFSTSLLGTAVQGVVTGISVQRVDPSIALQRVIASTTRDGVVTARSESASAKPEPIRFSIDERVSIPSPPVPWAAVGAEPPLRRRAHRHTRRCPLRCRRSAYRCLLHGDYVEAFVSIYDVIAAAGHDSIITVVSTENVAYRILEIGNRCAGESDQSASGGVGKVASDRAGECRGLAPCWRRRRLRPRCCRRCR